MSNKLSPLETAILCSSPSLSINVTYSLPLYEYLFAYVSSNQALTLLQALAATNHHVKLLTSMRRSVELLRIEMIGLRPNYSVW